MDWRPSKHPDSLQAMRADVGAYVIRARTVGTVPEQVRAPRWLVTLHRGRVERARVEVASREDVDAAAGRLMAAAP